MKKKCRVCKKMLDTGNFYHNKNTSDGLVSYCKKCTSGYSLANFISRMSEKRFLKYVVHSAKLAIARSDTDRIDTQISVMHDVRKYVKSNLERKKTEVRRLVELVNMKSDIKGTFDR